MKPQRIVGSVAHLPDHAFGPASLGWWGTIGFMLIEGMAFVLAAGTYFYLMPVDSRWPPASPPPALLYGSLFTVIALLSEAPNVWLNRAAHRGELGKVRAGLVLMALIGVTLLVVRGFEFTALNERWDHNAYGSILWALLMIHTVHVGTDIYDTVVLAVLVFVKPVDGRKLSDVSDNALYWHFVVVSWLAIYALIYLVPRWA
jgi:heme/copper-type cytochrome/quinol oxidase subunit 3